MLSDDHNLKLARIIREARQWLDELDRIGRRDDTGMESFITTLRMRASAKELRVIGYFEIAAELSERRKKIGTCDQEIRKGCRKILRKRRLIDDCQDDFGLPQSDALRPAVLCQSLLENAAPSGRGNMSDRSKEAPSTISRLQKTRAELVQRLLHEFESLVRAGATAGPRLDDWLEENPNSIVAQAMEKPKKEGDVRAILGRVDGGLNRGEAFELIAIHQDTSAEVIKIAWQASQRRKRGER